MGALRENHDCGFRNDIHLNKVSDRLQLTGHSDCTVAFATGKTSAISYTAQHPLPQLHEATPNSLLSIKELVDNGCINIFHPGDRCYTTS